MRRFVASAVALALCIPALVYSAAGTLPGLNYQWQNPRTAPAGQPPYSHWRSQFTPAPGAAPPSKMDEEKFRGQMAADGARPWRGLDAELTRARNAVQGRQAQ